MNRITTLDLRAHMGDWAEEKKYEVRAKQGWPAPFVEIRLMGPEGEAPWDGSTSGEIEIRGPWIAASYYESPDQAHRWTADGWFKTGDVCTMDDEGFIKIVDRAKDLVKSGGEWISSVDLENTLMGHPAVKEAAVVGIPHPKWGETPVAVIVAAPDCHPGEEELINLCRSRLASYKKSSAVVFRDVLPRNATGKVLKRTLRDELEAASQTAPQR